MYTAKTTPDSSQGCLETEGQQRTPWLNPAGVRSRLRCTQPHPWTPGTGPGDRAWRALRGQACSAQEAGRSPAPAPRCTGTPYTGNSENPTSYGWVLYPHNTWSGVHFLHSSAPVPGLCKAQEAIGQPTFIGLYSGSLSRDIS